MCIRDSPEAFSEANQNYQGIEALSAFFKALAEKKEQIRICLLYTSDAADERSSVDLGGRRIIKKKTT